MDARTAAGGKGPAKRITPFRWSVLGAIAVVGLAACAPAASNSAGYGSAAGPPTSASAPPAVPAGAAEVGIANFKFMPATVTIKVGDTVGWTNHDDIGHTVSFAGPGINSKVLQRNDRFSHAFDAPGTYTYICSIHPFMHGTVVVTG